MTTKTEEARGLLAIALDKGRRPKERLAALLKADDMRGEMKVGWAKLAADGQPLNYADLLAEVQDAHEADHKEKPKPAPKAAQPKKAAKPARVGADERGQISALVRSLLLDTSKPYAEIVEEVRKAHPSAKTTARSVASTAADMRRAGSKVATRRAEAAQK